MLKYVHRRSWPLHISVLLFRPFRVFKTEISTGTNRQTGFRAYTAQTIIYYSAKKLTATICGSRHQTFWQDSKYLCSLLININVRVCRPVNVCMWESTTRGTRLIISAWLFNFRFFSFVFCSRNVQMTCPLYSAFCIVYAYLISVLAVLCDTFPTSSALTYR